MMHIVYRVREQLIVFLLLALVAAASLSSLGSNNLLPDSMDYDNHLAAIIQTKAAFAEGQFPLRVMPSEQHEFRYPFYQFYSPVTYMFAGFVYRWITPHNPATAYKLTLWIALLLGGLYMYRLAYSFVNSKYAALLASVAYVTSPYYLIVLEHIGGFAEGIALGVLPATLFYTLQLYHFPHDKKYFLLTALTWSLLPTLHTGTFVYASLCVGLLLLFKTLSAKKYLRNLFSVAFSYLFSLILSAWFLVPMALLEKYFITSLYFEMPKIWERYKITLVNFFSPVAIVTRDLQGWATPGNKMAEILPRIHPNLGFPLLFGVAICIYALLKKYKTQTTADNWLWPLLTLFILFTIIVWNPLNLWEYLPHFFRIGQYSWRIMGQLIWIAALLFAWSIVWLFPADSLNKKNALIIFLCLIFASSSWHVTPENTYSFFQPSELLKMSELAANKGTFLMRNKRWSAIVPRSKDANNFLGLDATKKYCQQKKTITECRVPALDSKKTIVLPILYYPELLRVTVNGNPVAYHAILDKKLLLAAVLNVPHVINYIKIQFQGLHWANELSLLGWICWLLLLFSLFLHAPFLLIRTVLMRRMP
jgi:hypothetical protein